MNISTFFAPRAAGLGAVRSKAASVAAMLLGGVFIYIIGFSHIEVVHNAAHDTRHASAFPCH